MVVAADSLCMGCMDVKKAGACPNPDTCGWKDGTESGFFPQLPPRTVLENRYVLGRPLGQGGFGITYLAGDLQEFRKLALKEYFPTSFATRTTDRRTVTYAGPANREPYQYGLRKFEEEARTLQAFQNHPNIVTVMRSFKANGTGYIVMEYLDGITLLAHLERQSGSRLPFSDALRILAPIMDALREVHRAGITHRDVSPDNIYLCRSGRIKLLDFGAARLALRDQTQSQQLILKPGYTPEEQYRSAGFTGAYTDVYSLAATMYRSLTGQVPPEAPERLSEDHLVPPRRLAELPPYADEALIKALAVRAKDRYQTMEEFQREIDPPNLRGRHRKSSQGIFAAFATWWTIGAALMCAGCLLRAQGLFWLFWAGLVPAAVGLVRMMELRRTSAARRTGLWFLFGLMATAGMLVTAVNALGAVLLVLNIIVAKAIARPAPPAPNQPARPKVGLRFLNGEFAGDTLQLSPDSIVLGRVPEAANVVIAVPEISATHARVWTDPSRPGVWIEDLQSRNGTFIRKSAADSPWMPVHGREFLEPGDRFYLAGEEVATFEIFCG